MIDPFGALLLIALTVAIASFAVAWWLGTIERIRWKRILEHPGEILIEADQGDLGSLRTALVEIADVLLGIAVPGDSETSIDPMYHALLPESRVIVRRARNDGWNPPATELPHVDRLRSVGDWIAAKSTTQVILPLSEALSFHYRERSVARFAMVKLLDRVTDADRAILSKSSLYFHLGAAAHWDSDDEILAMHIIGAVRRSLHLGALPHLKRLLANAGTDFNLPDDLAASAKECVRALEWQIEQERLGRTLLRAAENSTESEALLRPVSPSTADTDRLLRVPSEDD